MPLAVPFLFTKNLLDDSFASDIVRLEVVKGVVFLEFGSLSPLDDHPVWDEALAFRIVAVIITHY